MEQERGGVTGYHENSSDPYKSYGASIPTQININISGGNIESNIYGGGYGYTEYLTRNVIAEDGGTFYGDSKIIITGSPVISGSIYAAGCGYNLTNLPELAQLYGTSYIEINGTPTISGSIFGGGAGINGLDDMAKVFGTSEIRINADLSAYVYGGGNIAELDGTTNVYVQAGTHTGEMYGGGNVGIVTGTSNVTISGGTNRGNIYGGGNQATVNTSNVTISGGTNSNSIFGGGNQGTVDTTVVNINGGTNNNVFAGGNQATVTTTSVININSGTTTAVYGGNNSAGMTVTNVNLQGGTATNIYGGSNLTGDVTTTNIISTSGNATNIYGGNNAGGTVSESVIIIKDGNIENIYGGNNEGGTLTTSNISILGGTIGSVFGGGNEATTTTSNVSVEAGKITNVYGGGNKAGVTTANVNIISGDVGNAFGGSNQSGDVSTANVIVGVGESNKGAEMVVTYDVSEAASWQTTEYPTYAKLYVTINNLTDSTITEWDAYINVADAELYREYTSSTITYENGAFVFDESNEYYGTNAISGNGSFTMEFEIFTNISVEDFSISYGFNGVDADGNTYSASSSAAGSLTVGNVYGGNNAGGTTSVPNVTVKGGSIENVFGGGNQATVPITNVNISGGEIDNVYGGGNAAAVNNDTSLVITGGKINNNIYGGGNEGIVSGNSNANIKDVEILGSAYGGGNGETAIVIGNSTLTVQGDTIIGFENCSKPKQGCAFAGGNAAATGTSDNGNSSTATINIVGGTIYGNIYGGANTSTIYGKADVNVGNETVSDNTLTIGNIYIVGTVFGGGEANASGSEIYDFEAISVTAGIDIQIDGTGYNSFKIEGSIFGSGNASTSSGRSEIYIKNFGTIDAPQKNISIQRADLVTMDNSAIALSGATDRTNEYSSEFFTISRIVEFKLKNNSTLYLNYGANLLQEFSSLVDIDGEEVLATVTIDEETGENTKNVDNRIYMYEGKNLNIATNEKVTAYGDVNGMTYFGLFTNTMSPNTSTGLYNHNFENGEEITNKGTFSVNSYVRGAHKENHDYTVDGFYTSIDNEGYIKNEYVDVTPPDDLYYIWLVGEAVDVTVYEISLTASKYATLGTTELVLAGFAVPNTKFLISGFSAGLADGIELIDSKDIPAINESEDLANTQFGLIMENGKSGWITNNTNNFYTSEGGTYDGNNLYMMENISASPSLTFCLNHSQNLTKEQTLGTVKIRFQVMIPVDDLNYRLAYADINITMIASLFQDDYYEAAITPGEEFELFTSTETNITHDGEFSTYYSLYIPDFSTNELYDDFSTLKRCIVSRDLSGSDYVFPANTRIVMLDLVTNTTYYYNVTSDDVTAGKNTFYLTDFIKMGSINEKYNQDDAYTKYFNKSQDLVYENFIFQVNFSEANITTDLADKTLLMELQDTNNETLIGVLGIQRETTKYSVFTDKNAVITADVELEPEVVYLSKDINLTVTTNFEQDVVNSKIIYDTKYLNQKVGMKVTWYDLDGNQLNSDTLMGTYFELDGERYYPRIDGTTRIKLADRLANVLSKITINTSQNTTIATGQYKLLIETFGSSDGIYYGLEPTQSIEKEVYIINGAYGLKVTTTDEEKIINSVTGLNQNGENTIKSVIQYSSSLEAPTITVSLERRDYSEIYSDVYNVVDLTEYTTDTFVEFKNGENEYEYIVTNSPTANMTNILGFKENLVTGTYKLVYKLYDDTTYIGEVYEYIIIR